MSEELHVKAYQQDARWVSDYNGILAQGDTFPQAVDAMIKKLLETEVTCIGRGIVPADDVIVFCQAYRTRSLPIWWAVVAAPNPLDYISVEFEVASVN